MKKKITFLSLIMILLLTCVVTLSMTSKAAKEPFSQEDVAKQSSCVINGEKRTLTLLINGNLYYNAGDETPFEIYPNALDAGINEESGVIWMKDSYDQSFKGCPLCWCNPDWGYNFWTASRKNSDNSRTFITDFDSLIYDEQDFVTGYKDNSGTIYSLPTVEELEEYIWPDGRPSPTPVPTVSPTAVPTATAVSTSIPITTPKINTSQKKVVKDKISIQKKKSYFCLYNGKKLICKYKLKNGKLTYKRSGKKTLTYTGVKSATYIYKSQNLVFITKKTAAYTVSLNGKKKCILKKRAKKIICKDRWGIKIKRSNSSYLNIRNK